MAHAEELSAAAAATDDFRAAANGFLAPLLDALPADALAQALTDARLTEPMWSHVRHRWTEGPAPPTEAWLADPESWSRLLAEVDAQFVVIRDLATLLHEWWVAGNVGAGDEHEERIGAYLNRVTSEAESFLLDLAIDVATGEADPGSAAGASVAQVAELVHARLEAQARFDSEVALRMTLRRLTAAHRATGEARVRTEVEAAAAVVAISHPRVIAALVDAARAVEFEPDEPDLSIVPRVRVAARHALDPEGAMTPRHRYLEMRLLWERDSDAEIQAVIDARRKG